jgi:glycosyltransferase involved in cell wall biosynthesis
MDHCKILWFNWRCWLNPDMGGAEVFTHEVMKRWVDAGHQITLFTARFPGSKPEELVDGVRIVRKGGKYSVYRQAKKMYKKSFRKEKYDFVIDEVNTLPFFTPNFVNNGEKVVSLIHQLAREYWFYEMPFPVSYFGYHYFEESWLKKYVNVPTATVSESTRNDLLSLGFKNVTVCSEGLNFRPLQEVPAKEDHPVVVYVGRLKQAKRPDHAIKAFKSVQKSFPNSELWIIGNGNYKKALVKMAGEGVKFFDGLNNGARRELIQRAWVLVNPSVREGFGLNIVEANALGIPCVAYNVAGLRDAVQDNETGVLVESGDVSALSEAICSILRNEPLRTRLSEKALAYSRGFSWDKVADEFINICRTS